MEPRIHYAPTRDGGNVAYSLAGRGPVLLLCQPYSHQQAGWRDDHMAAFYGALSDSHTLVRYDQRGFGMSSLDGHEMSYDLLLADLEAVVEASGAGQGAFDLFGISGLGYPAISFAVANPGCVRHLVLWGTPRRGIQFREGPRVRSMRAVRGIDDELALEIQARWVFGRHRVGPQQMAHAQAVFGAGNNEAYIDILWKTDLAEELAALTVPTLVLQPTGESLISVEHSREMATAIAGSEFLLVDGGYYPYQATDLTDLVSVLDDFLMVDPAQAMPPAPLNDGNLSPRELGVLRLLAAGKSNKEIAVALTLSLATVATHIRHIYEKTGSANRAEAASYAVRNGLA